MVRKRVLFPHPDGPMMTTVSFGPTSSDTSLTMAVSPYPETRCWRERPGTAHRLRYFREVKARVDAVVTRMVAARAKLVRSCAWVAMKVGMISVFPAMTPAKRRLPPSSPIARDQHSDAPAPMSFHPRGTKIVKNTWNGVAPRERAVRLIPLFSISRKRLAVNETTNGAEM